MRGEKDQIPQRLLQLNRETFDSWSPFLFTSHCVPCLFPSLPAVVRLLSPFSTTIAVFLSSHLHFSLTPRGSFLSSHYSTIFPLLHLLSFVTLPRSSSSSSHLVLFSRHLCPAASLFLSLNFLFHLFPV